MKWIGILVAWISSLFNTKILDPQAGYIVEIKNNNQIPISKQITITQIPKPTEIKLKPILKPTKVGDTSPWGVAKQVDETTWTMKIKDDIRMGTPIEILEALNEYRVRRGSQRLTWNEKLAEYAQSRAVYLNKIKNVDGHKGFQNFLDNENGFEKLGFTWLGENISFGYKMEGVHLIEWIYAGDKPHDDNQVNNRWNYVGIGVDGTATALIFGTGKR